MHCIDIYCYSYSVYNERQRSENWLSMYYSRFCVTISLNDRRIFISNMYASVRCGDSIIVDRVRTASNDEKIPTVDLS